MKNWTLTNTTRMQSFREKYYLALDISLLSFFSCYCEFFSVSIKKSIGLINKVEYFSEFSDIKLSHDLKIKKFWFQYHVISWNKFKKASQKKISESHHMENTWISHQSHTGRENATKTYRMKSNWEIGTHIFPIKWVLFSHPTLILWYTSSHGKCVGFPTSLS